jgi:AmmeMemoRadiSam system protein A
MAYQHVLDDHEKRELLRIARATLKEFLVSGRVPPGAPHRKSLTDPAPVFVTIHRGAELRGCIGTTSDTTPLYKAIQEMAVAAASRDPRFDPVTLDEVPSLVIEVSVLGERRRVTAPEDVSIGSDGLMVQARNRRGLLLPQVAADHAWDARTFLDKTCEKAGLPPDAWTWSDATVEAFTAQVFDETTVPPAPAMPGKVG